MNQLDANTAIVVFSGGQDSTTCLFLELSKGREVHLITFDYGQRHKVEIEAAERVAALAEAQFPGMVLSHEVIRLGADILKSTSPLVSSENLDQYADPQSLPGGLEKTFVPMRNQLFLTIAMNRALAHGAAKVVTGVCEEDYGGYPDCRRDFIDSLEIATAESLGMVRTNEIPEENTSEVVVDFRYVPQIKTPLMYLTKAESVQLASVLPGCLGALAFSHTAYDGAYPPDGKDHATLLREKGFAEARLPDPIWVRAGMEGYEEAASRLPEGAEVVTDLAKLVDAAMKTLSDRHLYQPA